MFLVNSRLDHFSAPYSRRVPLSRSYGVNLPSSLAMIHSSTLGSSPHPPVSVYGTGPYALGAKADFLASMVTCAVRSSEDSRYCRVSAAAYALQPSIPSDGGSVTPRSLPRLRSGCRNINRLSIIFPSRVRLRSRLTLIRLTLFRKPWVFGVYLSKYIIVTYAYIFFSSRSSKPHDSPSTPTAMLPYHTYLYVSQASAAVLMPGHELLRTL